MEGIENPDVKANNDKLISFILVVMILVISYGRISNICLVKVMKRNEQGFAYAELAEF